MSTPEPHMRWSQEMKLGRLAYEAHGRVVGNHTPWWMLSTEEQVAWASAADAAIRATRPK